MNCLKTCYKVSILNKKITNKSEDLPIGAPQGINSSAAQYGRRRERVLHLRLGDEAGAQSSHARGEDREKDEEAEDLFSSSICFPVFLFCCLGMIWGWFGDGLGWFGDGLGW